MTATPSKTPSAPANIFGLAPTLFYAILGTVTIIIAATSGFLFLRPRSEKQRIQRILASQFRGETLLD